MAQCQLIEEITAGQINKEIPEFSVGDTISIHIKIIEGTKERVQIFTGTVIARRGSGSSETLALYRVAYGSAMERVFLLNSPRIVKIEVVRYGRVRRSKLYFLRGVFGKKSKVKERIFSSAALKAEKRSAASEAAPGSET